MDIREKRDIRFYVKQLNGDIREFRINLDEVHLLVSGLGKPFSLTLTDTVGESWCIGLCNGFLEVDLDAKKVELYLRRG